MVEVHKFGGASIRDAAHIRRVGDIIKTLIDKPIVIVVSAMGKTTNALEKILHLHQQGDDQALVLFEQLKQQHLALTNELIPDNQAILVDINDAFIEIEWMIEDQPEANQDYAYDQVVSVGEVLSSKILSHYLGSIGVNNQWLDVRDIIVTDNQYREAKVDFEQTQNRIDRYLKGKILANKPIITQGFIGSSTENFTTTLGREGSDYTAAIFSNGLDADKMTVWKDVPGIMTADPKRIPDAVFLPEIDYSEAIEMTYYGAKVIHPKTIKPLENKHIPLEVKSYLDASTTGTIISEKLNANYPPIHVIMDNQYLFEITTKDFSYMAERNLAQILSFLDSIQVKSNMTQNSAITCKICIDYDHKKVEKIKAYLDQDYSVTTIDNLRLITVRHFDDATVDFYKESGDLVVENIANETVRMIVRVGDR